MVCSLGKLSMSKPSSVSLISKMENSKIFLRLRNLKSKMLVAKQGQQKIKSTSNVVITHFFVKAKK